METEAFWQSGEFWVTVAFVIFLVLFAKPILRAIGGALDQRAAKIKGNLEEAARLLEEATAFLAASQKKHRQAMKEAEAIIAQAKIQADLLRDKLQADLEASLKRREKLAQDRIALAEEEAVRKVRDAATDLALTATRQIIAVSLSQGEAATLIDTAISELPKKLH